MDTPHSTGNERLSLGVEIRAISKGLCSLHWDHFQAQYWENLGPQGCLCWVFGTSNDRRKPFEDAFFETFVQRAFGPSCGSPRQGPFAAEWSSSPSPVLQVWHLRSLQRLLCISFLIFPTSFQPQVHIFWNGQGALRPRVPQGKYVGWVLTVTSGGWWFLGVHFVFIF